MLYALIGHVKTTRFTGGYYLRYNNIGGDNMIERTEYLEKLKKWKDKDLIKVVTGIRRCGKSTLFELFIEYLKTIIK